MTWSKLKEWEEASENTSPEKAFKAENCSEWEVTSCKREVTNMQNPWGWKGFDILEELTNQTKPKGPVELERSEWRRDLESWQDR